MRKFLALDEKDLSLLLPPVGSPDRVSLVFPLTVRDPLTMNSAISARPETRLLRVVLKVAKICPRFFHPVAVGGERLAFSEEPYDSSPSGGGAHNHRL